MSRPISFIALVILIGVGYFAWVGFSAPRETRGPTDGLPRTVTRSGTYLCLPHEAGAPQTDECAFGLQTDDGTFYAVNFGQSADAMGQFQRNERITAEGFVVPKEALSDSHWWQYDMKGIFTITKMLSADATSTDGKIDIDTACRGALAYMTFPDGAAADAFVQDCIAGKHPEVIERYRRDTAH